MSFWKSDRSELAFVNCGTFKAPLLVRRIQGINHRVLGFNIVKDNFEFLISKHASDISKSLQKKAKGLTLETSAFLPSMMANLHFQLSCFH